MHQHNFERDMDIISSINVDMLAQAQCEEENRVPIPNAAVCLLWKHIHASSGCVIGSDQSRQSQIWSTSIMLNPPTLWITINPSNIHDPMAQIFSDVDINLYNLFGCVGPDREVVQIISQQICMRP